MCGPLSIFHICEKSITGLNARLNASGVRAGEGVGMRDVGLMKGGSQA